MSGLEPYAWKLVLEGERGPDGVPYSTVECGPEAYENTDVRRVMEKNARQAFTHQHPGTAIVTERWYPLVEFGEPDGPKCVDCGFSRLMDCECP